MADKASPDVIGGAGDTGAGLGGGLGALIGLLDQSRGGKRFDKDILDLFKQLQTPDYELQDINAPFVPFTGGMTPELYTGADPGAARQIADSPEMRAEQLQALSGLQEIGQEGLPEADRLAAEEGARAMRGALRSGEEQQVQNLRRRGRLGGGGEIAARAVGGRLASELGRGLNVDITRQALARRLGALRDYGSAAGAVRGQDVTSQMVNADALNRFKVFAAQNQQQAAGDNARARQYAQTYNVQTPQALAATNVQSAYDAAQYNQAYQNQLRNQQYQDELAKVGGQAGAYGRLSDAAYAKQAAKQKTYENIGAGLGGGIGGGIGLGML